MKTITVRTALLFLATVVSGALPTGAEAADAPKGEAWSLGGRLGSDTRTRALATIEAHAYRNGIRLDAARLTMPVGGQTLDSSVSDFYVRYAKAVGFGQIEPRAARIVWDILRTPFDSDAALAALNKGRLEAALASLPPPYPGYGRLVEALARYREIAARGGWPQVPKGRLLALGDDSARVPLLRRRLAAVGDFAASNVAASNVDASNAHARVFDRQLERAVTRFQRRHGLEPDGLVGSKTLAALNLPVGQRIAQIIANLERWRWMPRRLPLRRIEVNVAAAMLRVVDPDGAVLRMRVVVGSPRHPTPVLQTEIRKVVINPPWNVPDSIWRKEILPRLRRNPAYLASKNMRIVGRTHDPYGRRIDWRRKNQVPAGIRIRQQPGRLNALGRVKFHTPNRFDIYLHDTPARAAFQRTERALSHGCVRLQKPAALLAYLFRSQHLKPRLAREDDDRLRRTRTVPLATPLPVFLLYWTTFVAEDGIVQFRKDIYGRDARMTALLARPDKGIRSALLAGGCPVNPPRA
jgi:murein L,D-transpeptidase YcbB/YkuD